MPNTFFIQPLRYRIFFLIIFCYLPSRGVDLILRISFIFQPLTQKGFHPLITTHIVFFRYRLFLWLPSFFFLLLFLISFENPSHLQPLFFLRLSCFYNYYFILYIYLLYILLYTFSQAKIFWMQFSFKSLAIPIYKLYVHLGIVSITINDIWILIYYYWALRSFQLDLLYGEGKSEGGGEEEEKEAEAWVYTMKLMTEREEGREGGGEGCDRHMCVYIHRRKPPIPRL